MKRIFVLLLILLTAASANAAPQIMVNGDKNFALNLEEFSSNYTLGVWVDAAMPQYDIYNCALSVNTYYANIDYTTGYVVPPWENDPGMFLEHSMSAAEAGFPLPAGEDGIFGTIGTLEIYPVTAGSIIFDGINLHGTHPYPVIVTIDLYVTNDFQASYLADSVLVIIPEPMTICLLGLGALFLRKRKA
jgi:hypothetical protein